MAVAVQFSEANTGVEPGAEATCDLTIRNVGAVVDQFKVQLIGDVAAWTDVEPATVNLLPGAEGSVRLTFRPPRAATVLAGTMPFAAKVLSHEDPGGSVVEEAAVVIEPFTELAIELIPRTSHGSRVGRHELVVDNNGNHATTVEVLAADPDRLLDFKIDPPLLDLGPGTATFISLRAYPKKRFWKGNSKTLPFQAFVTSGEAEAKTADGALLQVPLLPKWTLKALAVALVIAVALPVLWYAYLKPQVKSAATKAVQKQTSKLTAGTRSANKKADRAVRKADKASDSADEAKKVAGKSTSANGPSKSKAGTLDNSDVKTAIDFRIVTSVAPGNPGTYRTAAHKTAKGKTLWITDMVLQNPAGDSGTLEIRRGKKVLFVFGLDNFRDIDYHFVQPLRFSAKGDVTLAVDCQNPGATKCTPSAYFDGQLVKS